jgi:hypothetical protein
LLAPAKSFFSGGMPKFLRLLKDKKIDRRRTKRGCFFDNSIIVPHHLPAVILGFFGGKKKFDPEKSYETFYRENVPEKPLQTHHDKLTSNISDSSVTTMVIFP